MVLCGSPARSQKAVQLPPGPFGVLVFGIQSACYEDAREFVEMSTWKNSGSQVTATAENPTDSWHRLLRHGRSESPSLWWSHPQLISHGTERGLPC